MDDLRCENNDVHSVDTAAVRCLTGAGGRLAFLCEGCAQMFGALVEGFATAE